METDSDVVGRLDELGTNRRRGVRLLDERNRQPEEESVHNMYRCFSLLLQAMAMVLLLALSLLTCFWGGAVTAKTFAQMALFTVVPFLFCSIFILCFSLWGIRNST